jgi:hypothetical protein
MKRRTDLYDLIRAMSKSEKRYFTIDAQKSGRKDSRYLELFQAINDLEEDDEKALRKKFGKNLPVDKNYLYEAILRSMRDYRSTNSLAVRIREMILDAKYLYERNLYDQCEQRLWHAKKLATELDDHIIMLEILKEEQWLISDRRSASYDSSIRQLLEDSNLVIKRVVTEMELLEVYVNLLDMVFKKFSLNNEEDIKNTKDRFGALLESYEAGRISPTSQRRLYQCRALYGLLLGNFNDVFTNYEQVIDWWDKHPLIKEEEFHKYIVDISNYLNGYLAKGQYQYIPKLIESLENSKPKNLHDKSLVFQKISANRLVYYINSGETKGIDEFLDSIEKGLSSYYLNQRSQLVLLMNSAILLFIQEDFKGCCKWCKMIFAKKKVASRLDIQWASRLLYLISEYEIDDLDGVEKALRSVTRYFRVNEPMPDKRAFEDLVLSTVQKLIFAPISEKKDLLRQFLTELKVFGKENRPPLGMNELFTVWANGKLTKKRMSQLLNQ